MMLMHIINKPAMQGQPSYQSPKMAFLHGATGQKTSKVIAGCLSKKKKHRVKIFTDFFPLIAPADCLHRDQYLFQVNREYLFYPSCLDEHSYHVHVLLLFVECCHQ